jgi:hypothetical protein
VKRVLFCAVVTVLVGCGGGTNAPSRSSPTPSATVKALAAWKDAVIVYGNQLQLCRGNVYPTRNIWAACMREQRQSYGTAAAAALRSLSRVKSSRECQEAATRLRRDIKQATTTQDELVKSLDRANNVITAGHDYRGPPLGSVVRRATHTIRRDLTEARELRTGVIKHC